MPAGVRPANAPSNVLLFLLAWLIPGAGHFALGKRQKAFVFAIVLTMMLIRTLGQAAGGTVAPQDVVLLLGYTALGLVASRLLWGIVGPRHARFSDFVRGPRAIATYLRERLAGTSRRRLGHNPAAAVMIRP